MAEIAGQYGFSVDESWLKIPGLYYSYGVCEDDQSFPQDPLGAAYDHHNKAVTLTSRASYTAQTCPYTVQPDGCECTGDNYALGADEKAKHGQDYGRWCAAWEDGLYTDGSACVVLALLAALTCVFPSCLILCALSALSMSLVSQSVGHWQCARDPPTQVPTD